MSDDKEEKKINEEGGEAQDLSSEKLTKQQNQNQSRREKRAVFELAALENKDDIKEEEKKSVNKKYENFWVRLKTKINESRESRRLYTGLYIEPETRETFLAGGIDFVTAIHEKQFHTLVFMDKSARPLAVFFRAIWSRMYPKESPPITKFMVGNFEAYREGEYEKAVDEVAKKFASSKDSFRGQKVLLVDEQICTGQCVERAKRVLEEIFKDNPPIIKYGTMRIKGLFADRENVAIIAGGEVGDYVYKGDRGKLVEEESGRPFVKSKKINPSLSRQDILSQIGKYETLGQKHIDIINQELKMMYGWHSDKDLPERWSEEKYNNKIKKLEETRRAYLKFLA